LGVEQELVVRNASPGLRRYVTRCVGYAARTGIPMRQREPAAPGVVLIFGLGPELRVLDPLNPTRPAVQVGSFLAGPHDRCAVVEHAGEMRGIEVNLTPLAARLAFREPMQALARQTVALEDLLGKQARRLEERLVDAETWDQRLDLIEAVLAQRLITAEPPPADIDWAWRRLTSARGRVRITDLATEIGCSRKHLATRFREHVGLPPSLVVRLVRFRRALDMLSSPHATVATIAYDCGYYDQAHFARDFRDFAATTPTAYVAEQRAPVTSVQDATLAAGIASASSNKEDE
jgi:AraC-like DNA-binding protein